MDQTLLTSLPTDIITNILSRLPVRTIISCQCVCKSLFQLVKTPEFANFHLSKSVPSLIIYEHERLPELLRIFEFVDELELDQYKPPYVPVAKFQMPFLRDAVGLEGSANGLLLLSDKCARLHTLYICNPITSEYINLPYPEEKFRYPSLIMYGFGVSKVTDQYKVVRICQECGKSPNTQNIPSSECQVYTLGTGLWRSVPHCYSLRYCISEDAFVKGNLHWLVTDLKESQLISCFDLETELFNTFSPPPPYLQRRRNCLVVLAVLGDCLCFCDNISENEVVIWVMKEYGVDKSWTKDFVINKFPWFPGESYEIVCPFKVFRNGDILMLSGISNMLYYSNKSKTTLRVDMFELLDSTWIEVRLHVSSFISLKSFAMENVVKF